MMRSFGLLVLLGVFASVVAGQDSCDVLAQSTLMNAAGACDEYALGEICAFVTPVDLKSPNQLQRLLTGETTSLNDIEEIILAQDEQNQRGAATFKIATYVENSWNLVPVEVLAFGDASIRNMAQPTSLQDLIVQPVQGVNVRSLPNDDARVLYAAAQGELVKVAARLEDSSWLQAISPNGEIGWIRSDAFLDDVSDLPIVTADTALKVDATPNFARFQTTATSLSCLTSNIRGGLLLQTPSDAPKVSLNINGLDISLSGTIWLTAIPLEVGTASVVYALQNNVEVSVPQGQADIAEGQFAVFFGALLEESSEVTGELPIATLFDGIELAELPVYLLGEPFYVPLDVSRVLQPRPDGDVSPLDGMLATASCRITTGEGGLNLRAGAGTDYPIQGVMGYRESADVLGRAVGSDGQNWWNIAPYLWVSGQTTVTGGDCAAVAEMPVEKVR